MDESQRATAELCLQAAERGDMTFPQIVGKLIGVPVTVTMITRQFRKLRCIDTLSLKLVPTIEQSRDTVGGAASNAIQETALIS